MPTALGISRATSTPAADPRGDALAVARAALKRAVRVRDDAQVQVEQLRMLIARLEADGKIAP